VREFSTTFPEYKALAASGFPILHTNTMDAILRSLESVGADLSDDQSAFQRALAQTELDTPTGHIRLDGHRQAVSTGYLQRVTKTPTGLTMRTQKALEDVEQTFNGYFASAEPLGRGTIECHRADPPAWARR
jgi:hypothetical protein